MIYPRDDLHATCVGNTQGLQRHKKQNWQSVVLEFSLNWSKLEKRPFSTNLEDQGFFTTNCDSQCCTTYMIKGHVRPLARRPRVWVLDQS